MLLDNILGPWFLGIIFSAILFGVTNAQVYVYYSKYPRDRMLHKIAVAVLWFLDSLDVFCEIHVFYSYFIANYGTLPIHLVWTHKLQSLSLVAIVLLVQSLYALRLWKLGSFHHGPGHYISGGAVIIGFGTGIMLSVEMFKTSTLESLEAIRWAIVPAFVVTTVVDFVFAVWICYYLRLSQTKAFGVRSKIMSMTRYIIISGLATSACSLTSLGTYVTMPNTTVYIATSLLMTRLYINSFLAMLNTRPCKRQVNDVDRGSKLTIITKDPRTRKANAISSNVIDITLPPLAHALSGQSPECLVDGRR